MTENKNSEALAILDAPAANTADTSTDGAVGATAAVSTVPGTLTPTTPETAAAGTPTTSGGENLYKPMFSVRTEKAIYIVCVLLGLAAIVVSVIAGDLNWPKVVSDTCGVMGGLVGSVASAFGVSYTTMRSL